MKTRKVKIGLMVLALGIISVCALGKSKSSWGEEISVQETFDNVNTTNNTIATTNDTQQTAQIDEGNIIEIEATGIGVAPSENCTPAQAVALAKRAAIIDAYRQLGEQMYGIKLSSNDTVRNMVLKNSNIKTKVNAVIRGAQVRESACQQGICQVSMELKLDGRVWSNILGGI